jgi:subtilisin family serine protease
MASAGDQNFGGSCAGDFPAQTGTVDCRILIAGTSMATPHVAGAAALIISVNAAYQSPAAMKASLCATADDISDPNEGCGRLDVYRAMARALGDGNPPAANPIP